MGRPTLSLYPGQNIKINRYGRCTLRTGRNRKEIIMTNYVAIPNKLIFDPNLRASTKRVAFALFAYRNKANTLCRSLKALAAATGCCQKTVIQAINELEAHRYLKRNHRHHFSAVLMRPVYASNRYVLRVDMSQGYTLIPRDVLYADVTYTQFAVMLLLFARQGRASHSYPSLRRIAATLWIAKSTVCLAVIALVKGQYVAKNHCCNSMGSYSCNCYYVIVVRANAVPRPLTTVYHRHQDSSREGGGLIFSPVMVTKI